MFSFCDLRALARELASLFGHPTRKSLPKFNLQLIVTTCRSVWPRRKYGSLHVPSDRLLTLLKVTDSNNPPGTSRQEAVQTQPVDRTHLVGLWTGTQVQYSPLLWSGFLFWTSLQHEVTYCYSQLRIRARSAVRQTACQVGRIGRTCFWSG